MGKFICFTVAQNLSRRIPIQNDMDELFNIVDGVEFLGTILKIRGVGFLEVENVTIDEEEIIIVCKFLIGGDIHNAGLSEERAEELVY